MKKGQVGIFLSYGMQSSDSSLGSGPCHHGSEVTWGRQRQQDG